MRPNNLGGLSFQGYETSHVMASVGAVLPHDVTAFQNLTFTGSVVVLGDDLDVSLGEQSVRVGARPEDESAAAALELLDTRNEAYEICVNPTDRVWDRTVMTDSMHLTAGLTAKAKGALLSAYEDGLLSADELSVVHGMLIELGLVEPTRQERFKMRTWPLMRVMGLVDDVDFEWHHVL